MGKRGPVVVPVELREMALKVTPLLLVIAIGITIALGSLPLLLIALAYALVELAGFPIWLAMLSSSVAGMAAGGVTVLIAIRRLRPHLTIWRRSATELRENVDFLKGKNFAARRHLEGLWWVNHHPPKHCHREGETASDDRSRPHWTLKTIQ